MQLREAFRAGLSQPVEQIVRQQMVKTEPVALLIERHQEIFKFAAAHEAEPRLGISTQRLDQVRIE